MAENKPVGCARPSGKLVGADEKEPTRPTTQSVPEETMIRARVGGKAPDFEAPAYLKGEFTSFKLSDHLGKWVLLCFYPADFTFT